MSSCWGEIDNFKTKKVVTDKDIEELFLAERELEYLQDFSKYKFLKRLYLNKNKIFHLSDGLKTNYVLNELYLQNNKLVDIKGCLHHLTCLQTLLLQSNQLTSLADVIHEFRHMGNLKILNLFNNPLAQELDYRKLVLQKIKSLELFDRKAVTKNELDRILKEYNNEPNTKTNMIGFGTHIPKDSCATSTTDHEEENRTWREFDLRPIEHPSNHMNKTNDNSNTTIVNKDQRLQQQIYNRLHNCSNMQYRTLNWEQVKRSRDPVSREDDTDGCHGGEGGRAKSPELLVCNLKMK